MQRTNLAITTTVSLKLVQTTVSALAVFIQLHSYRKTAILAKARLKLLQSFNY